MDMNEAVAKAIAGERAIAGLTVKELAKAAGIPERTLMRILQAERPIRVDQVFLLARAFGIEPKEILERAQTILARAPETADELPPTIAGEIRDLGLSDRNRREVEEAARETLAPAPGEVDERSGDHRRGA